MFPQKGDDLFLYKGWIKKNGGSEDCIEAIVLMLTLGTQVIMIDTFNFNIHDGAWIILRPILDCFNRGTKKGYLLDFNISSSRLIMFFNIPQN